MISSPVSLLAELALANVVDGTQAELVRACRDQPVDRYSSRLWLNVGQQDRPRSVCVEQIMKDT